MIKQQRLNRYYASNKGAYLYKCRDGKCAHMLKDTAVMLYNNHVEKDISEYRINYGYYIKEVKEIIYKLQYNSNTLF